MKSAHDRVDRDAAPGDQHAGLAGRAELRVEAAPRHLPLERQRRVFLADRAVGADRQDALARPLRALAGREAAVGMAHVVQLRAVPLRRLADRGNGAEPDVQAARHIQAGLDRLDDRRDPVLRQHAAGIDGADHQRPARRPPAPRRCSCPAGRYRRAQPGSRIWPTHQSRRQSTTP